MMKQDYKDKPKLASALNGESSIDSSIDAEKKSSYHPHDMVFRQTFGRKDVILDFLESRIPSDLFAKIDKEKLRLTNKSFVNPVGMRGESDLVFQTELDHQEGYLYFLVEHQSSPDKYMPLRFAEYNIQLMRQHLNEGNQYLPLILNICVYNGNKDYPYGTSLLEMFASSELAKKYMFGSFHLVDLHRSTELELLKDKKASFAELVLKQGIYRDFFEWFSRYSDVFLAYLDQGLIPYVEDILAYILLVDKNEHILEKVESINPKIKELAMSAAERLRQEGELRSKPKWIQEGRQEGRQEEKRKIAFEMLSEGYEPMKISRITGLSEKEIKSLSKTKN
jgi:predicted transposase/invertase (TIGR01784 family)